MSTLNIQHLLARLYTDERMLAEFLSDRDGFCRKFAGDAASFLRQIDKQQLEFFANSLRRKRAQEAKKLLPMTASALGPRFHEVFQRYSITCLPSGAKKHAADAMAFCEYLLADKQSLDKLTLEAARFERLSIGLHFVVRREGERPVICHAKLRRMPRLHLVRFAYELPALVGRADVRGPVPERRTLTLFVKLPGLCGIWYW